MVRAILAGTKTETRRIVKPLSTAPLPLDSDGWGYEGSETGGGLVRQVMVGRSVVGSQCVPLPPCRYGAAGSRLWVRETQRVIGLGPVTRRATQIRVRYEADGAESGLLPYPERLKGKPEIGRCLTYGGYRESSRLTLGVESVRVERLHEITEAGAKAEGVEPLFGSYTAGFSAFWTQINGTRAGADWHDSPWVWVIKFRRLDAGEGEED